MAEALSKRRLLLLVLALAALIAAGGVWLYYRATTLVLTREDLQREVDRKFPIEKRELVAVVRLSEPRVLLNEGSDRIGLGVTVTLEAPGIKPLSGHIEADGEVHYDPEQGTLFLDYARLEKLEAKGLSERDAKLAQEILNPLLNSALAHIPLYRLNPNDPRQARLRGTVKSLKVESGRVVIKFGV